MLRSGTTSYFHADGLGSITSLSNAAGSFTNTYAYDSFGKLTASTGSLVNPFQYTARESDAETGLYYYRARYYDLNVGRFLSEDPIAFSGGRNFYRFVYNSPIGFNDPMGLSPGDVQKIKDLCKKCTQGLTNMGLRRPGGGTWDGFKNDQQSLWNRPRGNHFEGCKEQAGRVKPCLEDPTLSGWTFSEEPWWFGFHTVVMATSSNPNDPIVYCDPWRDSSWTAPSIPPEYPAMMK